MNKLYLIGGLESSQLTNIFSEGFNHQPVMFVAMFV